MAALATAKKTTARPELEVGVEFVLMRENFHELPAAVRWASERGAAFIIVTHLIPYDRAHIAQAAYETCTDAALALFAEWEEKARAAGVDLRRSFEVGWKYSKTPEEMRIIDYVNRMKAEAEERRISLDLQKLIDLDRVWLGKMEEVFAQAGEVATATGIDLRLPEIVPRSERQCHFIEDGAVFVAWNGEINPCYFLWHRYNCYASGWDQKVRPKTFGNLADSGILEIWNSPAFSNFRESVLDYDYPYCASCSLAPCDYVQTEEFEQDCHIKGEPCGSCLWCMGLFQCLR
jgi:putative metalloenzyme radical SAM/SPASM domain maturase